jgi:hypothetical protein
MDQKVDCDEFFVTVAWSDEEISAKLAINSLQAVLCSTGANKKLRGISAITANSMNA